MASTNKTPVLGLNQYIGSDVQTMEDVNIDNATIDTALANKANGYVAHLLTLSDIGITAPTSMEAICDAFVRLNAGGRSKILRCSTSAGAVADAPATLGSLRLDLIDEARLIVQFFAHNQPKTWIGDVTFDYSASPVKCVWSGWKRLATAEPPQKYNFPPLNGVQPLPGYSSNFWKTQERLLMAHFAFAPTSGGSLANGNTVAVLPEGFRPSGVVMTPGACNTGSGWGPGVIVVNPNGNVVWYGGTISSSGYITGSLQFVTAS